MPRTALATTSRRPNHTVSFAMPMVLNANGFEPMEKRASDTNSRTVFGPSPVGPAILYGIELVSTLCSWCQMAKKPSSKPGPRASIAGIKLFLAI